MFRLTRSIVHAALTIAALGASSLLASCGAGGGGGTAAALLPIAIPPDAVPAPPITASVGQTVTANCCEASITRANASGSTLFNITGLRAGTAQLLVSHTNPATTAADSITVIP